MAWITLASNSSSSRAEHTGGQSNRMFPALQLTVLGLWLARGTRCEEPIPAYQLEPRSELSLMRAVLREVRHAKVRASSHPRGFRRVECSPGSCVHGWQSCHPRQSRCARAGNPRSCSSQPKRASPGQAGCSTCPAPVSIPTQRFEPSCSIGEPEGHSARGTGCSARSAASS